MRRRSAGFGRTVTCITGLNAIPGHSANRKFLKSVASTVLISATANLFPMQDRGPMENGKNTLGILDG